MGKLIEKFKNFLKKFKKEPVYQLQEGTTIEKGSILDSYYKDSSSIVNKELENGISQYLYSYLYLINNYDTLHIPPSSYDALVRINTAQGYSSDKNFTDEEYFMEYISNNPNYACEANYDSTGTSPVFYHVRSLNYTLPKNEDLIRLYLNCSNDNIAELATNLVSSNNMDNFYLKFVSSVENYKYPRSSKVIIYTDREHYLDTVNNINYLKEQRPDLFVDSEKTNPFQAKVNDFITYGFEPLYGTFTKLDGNQVPAKSNDKQVALALEDSYINVVRELAMQDKNIIYSSDPTYSIMQNLEYIDSNYHDYLIKSMEAKLEVLSHKNGLEIRGINPIYNEQSNENKDINQEKYEE